MNEGKIIEYIDQGSFVCTLCLQDKGKKLHLLTLSNREVNLPLKRTLLASDKTIQILGSREDLLNYLKNAEDLRSRLQGEIRVRELWELVRDEEASFDYKYLTQLCFGEEVSDDHISALVRALFEDKLYFKMKEGRFLPNSEERVETIMRQREEEAAREENLRLGSAWIRQVLRGESVQPPHCREDVVALLAELALYGKEAPNLNYGRELLSRVGLTDVGEAKNLLIQLGVWEEDENLELFRKEIRTGFSEACLQEVAGLACGGLDRTGREDLRHLPTFTIDGPLTMDFDDAISVEVENGTINLGIHIADVASVIQEEGAIDREASHRCSTLYLPRRQIPMMPPELSHDIVSLVRDCDRPAISLLSRFDGEGRLLESRFTPSLIRVRQQLTYDDVNVCYMQDDVLCRLYRLTEQMREKRLDQGALILSLPEIVICFGDDGAVSLQLVAQDTPSRKMVAELMIFYNWMAAKLCLDHKLPTLYRTQEAPDERLSLEDPEDIYLAFKQRRKLKPLMIDTKPSPHRGLGLDVYTNASSPIRRFLDLVIQRQISGYLTTGAPVYDGEQLEQLRMRTEPVLKGLEMMKRNRNRYWIQKYLQQHRGEEYPAIVLYSLKKRHRILLTDFLLITEMKKEEGRILADGRKITVRIKNSDPWSDELKVEYAGG